MDMKDKQIKILSLKYKLINKTLNNLPHFLSFNGQ